MKVILALTIVALGYRVAPAQVSFGVKAGSPISDRFLNVNSGGSKIADFNRRYTVGGTFELTLPFRLGLSLDALYTRGGIDSTVRDLTFSTTISATRLNQWEFPILVKYRLPGGAGVTPFVTSGVSIRRISGRERRHFSLLDRPTVVTELLVPSIVRGGFVAGGGVDFKVHRSLIVSPEFRYTRYTLWEFARLASFDSQTHQLQLLLGVRFSK